jgi:hypothetical protein
MNYNCRSVECLQIYLRAQAGHIGMRCLPLYGTKIYPQKANVAPVSVASFTPAGASLLVMRIMSKENAARRNRALRKIRKAQHVDPEIKLAIEVILDLLSGQSGYNVAWPSAATIAKRLRRSRRSGQWYVKIIKALDIFRCFQLSPEQTHTYCEQHYGFRPKLNRCVTYAPNLFTVNPSHPLWNKSKTLPDDVDREMGEIIRTIKAKRNVKTTSRLASDPTNRPKQQAGSNLKSAYCLETIRERLRKTLDAIQDDDANELILRYEEEQRWCREGTWNNDVRDIIDGVANDAQVFRLSSVEVERISAPPSETLKVSESAPPVIELPIGSAARQPYARGFNREQTPHPPTIPLRSQLG